MILTSSERIAQYRARGFWGTETFNELLQRNAARVPQREAIVDPPNRAEVTGSPAKRVTWGELDATVARVAAGLLDQGLVRDDVVLVQMANTWELLALYLACFRVGLIVTPVPSAYREHELDHILERTRARAVVTHDRIAQHAHGAMALGLMQRHATVRVTVLVDAPAGAPLPDRAVHFATLADSAPRDLGPPPGPDDVVTILWTSGSEGRPKGVARSHAQWLAFRDTFGPQYGVTDGARLLTGRPLVTHGAFVGSLVTWLVNAATLVSHHPFALTQFVDQLRSERITFTSLAPAILVSLLSQPQLLEGVDFRRLRYIGSGSAPLSARCVSEFAQQFGVQVVNMFGSTEGASLASGPQDVPDPAQRATWFPRLGAPGFGWREPLDQLVQTRLVDPDSGEIIDRPGRAGEMCYRGPLVFDGYYNDPELTARALDADGYYHSGDLFEIVGDRDQFYRFVGRAKDIIVRGGYNISAQEVEELILRHPHVQEAAVVGMPDERLGERLCAVVVLRAGAPAMDKDGLVRFLRDEQHVAAIKLPEKLLVLDGALPKTANTKVDKAQLRRIAAQTTETPDA